MKYGAGRLWRIKKAVDLINNLDDVVLADADDLIDAGIPNLNHGLETTGEPLGIFAVNFGVASLSNLNAAGGEEAISVDDVSHCFVLLS